MSSALAVRRVPRPEQVAHAPNGELKEKCRGSSSANEMPHAGQPYFSEKSCVSRAAESLRPCRTISTRPSASRSAVSTESASRPRSASRTASRSTTTDTSWFTRRLSTGGSARSTAAPSTTARTKPCLRADSKSSRNSPLRPRTSGASTSMRVPSGQPSTVSAIWPGLWRSTGRPQFAQCGVPARAYSRRR